MVRIKPNRFNSVWETAYINSDLGNAGVPAPGWTLRRLAGPEVIITLYTCFFKLKVEYVEYIMKGDYRFARRERYFGDRQAGVLADWGLKAGSAARM